MLKNDVKLGFVQSPTSEKEGQESIVQSTRREFRLWTPDFVFAAQLRRSWLRDKASDPKSARPPNTADVKPGTK